LKRAAGEEIVRIFERKYFGQFDYRVLPQLANRWKADARRKSRRDHGNPFIRQLSNKTDAALCKCSARVERQIIAALKKVSVLATESQPSFGQEQFDSSSGPGSHQFIWACVWQRVEHFTSDIVIDRAAIVRVDQAVIPDLVALINVRHTRRTELQQRLRKRIDRAQTRNLFRNWQENRREFVSRRWFQNFRNEIAHRSVPFFVRLDPAGIDLRLVKRLGHVSLNSLDVLLRRGGFWFTICSYRPGPQQSLVEQILLVCVRRFQVIDRFFPAAICQAPAVQRAAPELWDFGNGKHSRTNIFTAFCVVCGGSEQARRPVALSMQVQLVKCLYARSKLLRLSAPLVQRCQPVVNVKHSVLERFGHDRPCGLLEFQDEMRVRGAFGSIQLCRDMKEQHVPQIIEDRLFHSRIAALGCDDCALNNLAIFFADRLTRHKISSVNREAGDSLAHGARERLEGEIAIGSVLLRKPIEHVPKDVDIVRQSEFHYLQLFRIQQVTERNRVTDETMECFSDRRFRRRIDQQLCHLICKIVASGSVHRPVLAQRFGTSQDFFCQHVNGARICDRSYSPERFRATLLKLFEIFARQVQTVRMIDAEAGQRARAYQIES